MYIVGKFQNLSISPTPKLVWIVVTAVGHQKNVKWVKTKVRVKLPKKQRKET